MAKIYTANFYPRFQFRTVVRPQAYTLNTKNLAVMHNNPLNFACTIKLHNRYRQLIHHRFVIDGNGIHTEANIEQFKV